MVACYLVIVREYLQGQYSLQLQRARVLWLIPMDWLQWHTVKTSTCLKSQQSSLDYHWLLFTFEIHWLSIHLVDRWAYLFSLAHNKNKTAAMWAIFCLQWWCNFFSKNYFRIASAQRKSCVATLQQVMWQLKIFQKKKHEKFNELIFFATKLCQTLELVQPPLHASNTTV